VLRDAPKPILVHFKSGADRTGCVATLYRYAMAGENAEAAACELSLRYGHFPYLTSKNTVRNGSARIYSASHVPAVPSSAAVVP
jgi:protein tyrosine/serine phosphatase